MKFSPFSIGEYRVIAPIGAGGMAEVFRAIPIGNSKSTHSVAIKRILPLFQANDDIRKMFRQEARLYQNLNHANLIRGYSLIGENEGIALAMEYIDGIDLATLMNRITASTVPLPSTAAAYIVREVCRALSYLHSQEIIHSDVSMTNIIVSRTGKVTVIDLGIALTKDSSSEKGRSRGTRGYMSPEQARGEVLDHRTDLFSTAIVLYELLTQRRWSGNRKFKTLPAVSVAPAKQVSAVSIPSSVPPLLREVMVKGLTRQRELRYQSAKEITAILEGFLARTAPHFSQQSLAQTLSPHLGRST